MKQINMAMSCDYTELRLLSSRRITGVVNVYNAKWRP